MTFTDWLIHTEKRKWMKRKEKLIPFLELIGWILLLGVPFYYIWALQ